MVSSVVEVVKNEVIYKLKVVLTLSLILDMFLMAIILWCVHFFGNIGGTVAILFGIIINGFIIVRVARGFDTEEVLKDGGFKQ